MVWFSCYQIWGKFLLIFVFYFLTIHKIHIISIFCIANVLKILFFVEGIFKAEMSVPRCDRPKRVKMLGALNVILLDEPEL